MQNLTDQELINLTLSGDLAAFEQIVLRYEKPLLRYASRLLNQNLHDCEDVISETFFKAYKYLNSYNQDYQFSSWLYRIAHNQAVNLIKSKSKMFFMDLSQFNFMIKEDKGVDIQLEELEKILDKLKVKDKNILILYYLEEKSLNEIADILNINSNTVAKQLSRARSRAKKIVEEK